MRTTAIENICFFKGIVKILNNLMLHAFPMQIYLYPDYQHIHIQYTTIQKFSVKLNIML